MRKKTAFIILTIFFTLASSTAALATEFSRTNVPAKLKITASALNVRSGPSTSFQKVGLVYQNQIVQCLGKLGTWYVIHMNNDVVGVVSGKYVKPYYPPSAKPAPQPTSPPQPAPEPAPQPSPEPTVQIGQEEQKMLDLINQERAKAGVAPLKVDSKVMEVAKIKAQDMVKNNYFSHTSPTYGSPFDMLKKFGVTYTYAGENLAGNSSVEAAHAALMASEGHRKNILNPNFTHIGIGIEPSQRYGKIFVQMFIGR